MMKYLCLSFTVFCCFNIVSAQNKLAFLKSDNFIAKTPSTDLKEIRTIPFELDGGMIIVRAKISGETQNFILDTGAPSLILNQQVNNSTSKVQGISGESKAKAVKVKHFSWAGIDHDRVDALALDMSAIEKLTGRKIKGLIGFNLIKNHELMIDYDRQIIQLYPSNSFNVHHVKKPLTSFSFDMQGHLPIINVRIGKRKLRFGLDTGAEVNILNQQLKKKLSKHLSDVKKDKLQGIDDQIIQIEKGKIANTQLEEIFFKDMEYAFLNLSEVNEEANTKIDGILGFPFFKHCKISFNYQQQKIYVWDLKNSERVNLHAQK